MTKIAIVQHPPRFLDRTETIHLAAKYVGEAAGQGAGLVVFPEAFIPGYPSWIWRLRPGGDWGLSEELHARLLKNAVTLDSDELLPLQQAARENEVTVVCGINEKDSAASRSTLYNSVVVIGDDGGILHRHRKLMPTNPERMVWGFGDGSGLKVIDTVGGRIGALVCWENYMPLARYAMYAQGIEIYIAPTYDSGDGWIGTLQHIAREGGCWVAGAGVALRSQDLPDDLPERERLFSEGEDWINPGDSIVVAPGGDIVAGPLRNEQGILYADLYLDRVGIARRAFDVAGHYSRPDVFTLHVDTQEKRSIAFD